MTSFSFFLEQTLANTESYQSAKLDRPFAPSSWRSKITLNSHRANAPEAPQVGVLDLPLPLALARLPDRELHAVLLELHLAAVVLLAADVGARRADDLVQLVLGRRALRAAAAELRVPAAPLPGRAVLEEEVEALALVRLLRLCKRATIQFVFVKPVFAALSLLMLACGKYHTLAYQLILVVVYNISYSVALYGLWLFYLATRHILQPFNPVLKFFAVKSVVFLTFWQNSLLDFIPGITNEQTFAWKDFILCVEMVPFAFVHLLAFNSSQFKKNLDRLPDSEVLNNMKEVLSLSDILADAYHNFMPSYRDYMLQRGGESTGRARGKNKAAGFGDTSSSEGSPTPMAHSNPRVPRFVIDDEDDDEMEEIDLESNVTITTSSAELPVSTKNAMPELKLPAKKEEGTGEADADVVMANPQDDDHAKTDDDTKEVELEEGTNAEADQRSAEAAAEEAPSVEAPTRQRSVIVTVLPTSTQAKLQIEAAESPVVPDNFGVQIKALRRGIHTNLADPATAKVLQKFNVKQNYSIMRATPSATLVFDMEGLLTCARFNAKGTQSSSEFSSLFVRSCSRAELRRDLYSQI
ncbi:hypothetical protein ON010_g5873 [Phytophthora cinnamomi]|nr:hypothetical protein ON010_g5873 [Phytophthora cinnamomi]